MREIPKANSAALNKINWLFSEIASVPLVISSVTNDVIRNMIGTADAIGDGSPNLLLLFVNFIFYFKNRSQRYKKVGQLLVKLSHYMIIILIISFLQRFL